MISSIGNVSAAAAAASAARPMMEVMIPGTINLRQFYGYGGRSDADTMILRPNPSGGLWRPLGEATWRSIPLDFFRNAFVDAGRGERKPVLRRRKLGEGEAEVMTLRLQGVDAPELHYEAVPAIPVERMTREQRARWQEWDGVQFRQYGSIQATLMVAGALRLFRDYLSRIREKWIPLEAFLAGAGVEAGRPLSEMIGGSRGWIIHPTWEAVFVEKPATLRDREGRGIASFP